MHVALYKNQKVQRNKRKKEIMASPTATILWILLCLSFHTSVCNTLSHMYAVSALVRFPEKTDGTLNHGSWGELDQGTIYLVLGKVQGNLNKGWGAVKDKQWAISTLRLKGWEEGGNQNLGQLVDRHLTGAVPTGWTAVCSQQEGSQRKTTWLLVPHARHPPAGASLCPDSTRRQHPSTPWCRVESYW